MVYLFNMVVITNFKMSLTKSKFDSVAVRSFRIKYKGEGGLFGQFVFLPAGW